MSNSSNVTQADALANVLALIAGTQKYFPSTSFTLGGKSYTTAQLIQLLQGLASAMSAVIAAHASVKDALKALGGVEANVAPVMRDYVKIVHSAYDSTAQALADFGLKPPKARAPRTSEQNAAAAAKAKATRIARGTKGKKQLAGVKGGVTGVNIVPVTSAPPATTPPTAEQAPGTSTTK